MRSNACNPRRQSFARGGLLRTTMRRQGRHAYPVRDSEDYGRPTMKWHRKRDYLSAALLMNGLSLVSTVAQAQQQQQGQDGMMLLEEVVITARAREEALQDVPISVSTVSGSLIDESGI